MPPCPVTKAYRNDDFLNSSHARHIRILAEYEETQQRLRAQGVKATVMIFGSARAKNREQYDVAMAKEVEQMSSSPEGSEAYEAAAGAKARLEQSEWMIEQMDKITELSRRLTEWGFTARYNPGTTISGVARSSELKRRIERSNSQERGLPNLANKETSYSYVAHSSDTTAPSPHKEESRGRRKTQSIFICTGGGPGFMEAANKGAYQAEGRSIGMGITLPFEKGLNPYVTPELAFEYHYFFTRKFWMAFYMQALVVAPGGFGTCDELFEIVTLKQTGKMNKQIPIVLFGKQYWEDIINWKALARYGTIKEEDISSLLFTDSIEEAFEYVTQRLLEGAAMVDDYDHGD